MNNVGMSLEEIGSVIKLAMESKGLSQVELAKKVGLHKDVINAIINGRKGKAGLVSYETVLNHFGLTVSMRLPRVKKIETHENNS